MLQLSLVTGLYTLTSLQWTAHEILQQRHNDLALKQPANAWHDHSFSMS